MRHTFELGAIIKIFGDPHVVVERHVLRHVTEARSRLQLLFEDVETGNGRATRCRGHKSGENPHRCCLACAIGSEKTHDLALADLEIQTTDRGVPGVALSKVLDFNHRNIQTTEELLRCRKFSDCQRAANVTVSTRCVPLARRTPTTNSTLVPLFARPSRVSTSLTEFTFRLPIRKITRPRSIPA